MTVATLSHWRDRFLAGGETALKSRDVEVDDQEKQRLKSAVATVSVENELLREKIARHLRPLSKLWGPPQFEGCKLRALIRVEDLRLAPGKSRFQR